MPLKDPQVVQAGSSELYRPEEVSLLNLDEWRGAFGTAIRIFDGLYKNGFRGNIKYSVAIRVGENMDAVRNLVYMAPCQYVYESNSFRIFDLREKGFLVGYVVYVILPS